MTQAQTLTIALAGNPNSGKTTIFNNLTGTRQKVGNWPGVTVEKKEGHIHYEGRPLTIIDLPGTYSLTPFSIEEIVARDFILDDRPDVVIDIIDSSNLERSLYLATQLRELDCRVIFALNMTDLSQKRGIRIDTRKLSDLLDVPVITTVGNRNRGMDGLLEQGVAVATSGKEGSQRRKVRYSHDIEEAIEALLPDTAEVLTRLGMTYTPRWTAIKLLEEDEIIRKRLLERSSGEDSRLTTLFDRVTALRRKMADLFDDDLEMVMTDERYGFIAGIMKEVQTTATRTRVDRSRNIDLVLTNRYLGFPIFLFFIWAMFQTTFTLGVYPMEWIDTGVGIFSGAMESLLPDGLIKGLVVDGIIAGVGSVVVFLPNILILFFFIALFEDTGYMARAAFLMDRVMHLIGLHGKSFIPMLMGFGCNVPAIMATRTLESEKDRLLTILITPFMSCSAKLPVYIILAGTFFGARAGTVIFAIYLLGIVVSILSGRLLRSTLFKGEDAPFVMELPPYRTPMLKSLMIHMWDRSKQFLKKMGGIILVGAIAVWALSSFPQQADITAQYHRENQTVRQQYAARIAASAADEGGRLEAERDVRLGRIATEHRRLQAEHSLMGRMGRFIAPAFAPLGLNWQESVALVTGFVAKEIVVSTLGILYGADTGEEGLQQALTRSGLSAAGALAMMAFVLLYVPCLATIATIRKETVSYKWPLFSLVYSTTVAWGISFLVYQGGRLSGLG